MKKVLLLFNLLFISSALSMVSAQSYFSGFENLFTPVRNYVVYRTDGEITIDGKANETSWQLADWSEEFVDIEGTTKPLPKYKTRVKMLWDNQNLFILSELEEPNVWSYYENHDLIVFEENDFEVFIDPDDDTHNYFEIEINARNTIFDLYMPKPYRNGGIPLITWNTPGLKSAVFVDGTINNPADTDKNWTVEMAIPFSALRLGVHTLTPRNNDLWRIDFSRVQWQTEIINGKYTRKKDVTTNRVVPEDNWVWNPTGLINMHFPERWGILRFSENHVNEKKVLFQQAKTEELKKYLWLIYYKQKKYQGEKGKYAKTLSEIDIPETVINDSGEKTELKLFATEHQFVAELVSTEGIKITINNDGHIQKIKQK